MMAALRYLDPCACSRVSVQLSLSRLKVSNPVVASPVVANREGVDSVDRVEVRMIVWLWTAGKSVVIEARRMHETGYI